MDLQRFFLFLLFVFSSVLVWDSWQRYQNPEKFSQLAQPSETQLIDNKNNIVNQANVNEKLQNVGKKVTVKTDIFEVQINTIGGDISRLDLLHHPDGIDKSKPFQLFQQGEGTHNFVAQSGLLGTGVPTHNSFFIPEQESYELGSNESQIQVRLVAENQSLANVVKVITFHKSSYLVDISYEIENISKEPITFSSYYQFVRDDVEPAGSTKMLPTFTGPAVYTENDKFKKINFEDITNEKAASKIQADNGWIGFVQHYFVAAWLPPEKTGREYFTRKLDGNLFSAGLIQPDRTIKPGEKTLLTTRLYAGPAKSHLDELAPGLGLSVDYGWVKIIAAPLFWMMSLLHGFTGNWGVAIILLTVLIKIAFFPLSAASYRSMAKMRVVAPKLEKIKEQYKDDREQLNRAMMDLYKTEKINPLGGCLPMLIQIPVFIALFWAILSSVEMRYAPFIGWISDLSKADPYYVLPVIMGLSMIVQSRLNPTPADPIQAKVMQIMPVAFSVVFFFFPAGLVLYSIVNNLLSIAQQWYITRTADAEIKIATSKR